MSSDLVSAMSAAASGLRAQTVRLRVSAENLANANSTGQAPGADHYQRKAPVFEAYLDRSQTATGMIRKGDWVYQTFKERGWTWGGDWRTIKDYQHFQKP